MRSYPEINGYSLVSYYDGDAVKFYYINNETGEQYEPEILIQQAVYINKINELEDQLAQTDEITIQLYEANLKQETINAEQDEAIIEIYETMGVINNG